jgi:hypothetical protein
MYRQPVPLTIPTPPSLARPSAPARHLVGRVIPTVLSEAEGTERRLRRGIHPSGPSNFPVTALLRTLAGRGFTEARQDSSLFRFSPSTRRLPARTQRKLPISTRSSPRRYGRRPAEWCPNPCAENQSSVNRQFDVAIDPRRLHYRVDTSRIARDDLIGQIVVARNREDKRLLASRLIRFDHTDVLVFDQCENQPALLANGSSWRILGTACADRKS